MSKKISLKAARVDAGLTQDEAARRLGMSRQNLIALERQPEKASVKEINALASLYGFKVEDIDFKILG